MSTANESSGGMCCAGMILIGILYLISGASSSTMQTVVGLLFTPVVTIMILIIVSVILYSRYFHKGPESGPDTGTETSLDSGYPEWDIQDAVHYPYTVEMFQHEPENYEQKEEEWDVEEERRLKEEEDKKQREIAERRQKEEEERLKQEIEERKRIAEEERKLLEEKERILQENLQLFDQKLADYGHPCSELVKEYISKNERIFFDQKYRERLQYIYEEHLKELGERLAGEGYSFESYELEWLTDRLKNEVVVISSDTE